MKLAKKLASAALLVCALLAAPAMTKANAAAVEPIWQVCRAIGKDPAASVKACTQFLDLPEGKLKQFRTYAFSNRGNAYVSLQRYDEALADLNEALRLDAGNETAYVGRGNVHFWRGENDLALKDFALAIKLDPRDANPQHGRGNVYFNQGRYEEAIKSYSEAIRINPKFFNAYSGRANVYAELKQTDRAISDLSQALKLNPSYVNALVNRGNNYMIGKRFDEAIADYDRALALKPETILALSGRAGAYGLKKDYERSVADFTKALELDPSYLNARYGRGQAYKELGKLDLAAADFRNILAQKSDFLNTRDLLADVEKAGAAASVPSPGTNAAPAAGALAAIKAQRRVALVIGNGAYPQAALANPHNDAADVGARLQQLGFDVVTGYDLTLSGFSDTVNRFVAKAQGADVAVFYYSGHAMQVDGENWLLPVDTRVRSLFDVQQFNVSLQRLLHTVDSQAKTTLVFLDGCRNNPFADALKAQLKAQNRAYAETRGLARLTVDSPDTLVVFATQPNDVAADGTGRNSPFTQAFLANVGAPGVEVETLMKRVTADVKAATGDKQRPERLSGLTTEFYFVPPN
ncbi:tetratricopeptide repeat protein [Labrys sp. KB_33_2]|uniref:tetratricopeptide repeat protein n=1 Tax=Labrys sp. KB_33_2 TaxID=3237479 RepID=UPI003F8EEA6F